MNKGQNIIFTVLGILVVGIGVIVVIKNKTNQGFVDDSIPIRREIANDGVDRPRGIVVPPDEIVSGGPTRDGIPSIDAPIFVVPARANFLTDDDVGIAVSREGVNRFYPFQILVWHEIVNDTINGKRIVITYCPLCYSGIVFDPFVGGERVEFGTSGKLWNSNLVMYDRKTQSLWSQILGQAIAGEMAGEELSVIPSDVVRFGAWKRAHPEGEVLSRDTGHVRSYGSDPYGDYYTSSGLYFPVKTKDSRMPEKEFVAGVVIDSKAKAYPVSAIKQKSRITDTVNGHAITITYEHKTEEIRIIKKTQEGDVVVAPVYAYWFSWAAAHPNTDVYQ